MITIREKRKYAHIKYDFLDTPLRMPVDAFYATVMPYLVKQSKSHRIYAAGSEISGIVFNVPKELAQELANKIAQLPIIQATHSYNSN